MISKCKLVLFAMICACFLGGCANLSSNTTPVAQPKYKPADKHNSLVIFMRPFAFGKWCQSALYDGLQYIGTISATQQIAYETTPGNHMFMVIDESADFMRADLLPNKTYYAAIVARPGMWKARYSFRPQNGQISQQTLDKWLADTTQVTLNQRGIAWDQANRASVLKKHDEYLPKWKSKPARDQQTLHASSGR